MSKLVTIPAAEISTHYSYACNRHWGWVKCDSKYTICCTQGHTSQRAARDHAKYGWVGIS